MRTISVIAACCLAAALHAASVTSVVPLDHVTWSSDSYGPPTALGLARRVQAYLIVDMANTGDPGEMSYHHVKNEMMEKKYADEFRVMHICITINQDPRIAPGGKESESWIKARDPDNWLLRAFGGDAPSVLVLVDGRGKVCSITRPTGVALRKDATKGIEPLFAGADPIKADASQFPAALLPTLKLLRFGEATEALKSAQALGADGQPFIKSVVDQAKGLIEDDARTVADKLADSGLRFIAWRRMNDLIAEDGDPSLAKSTLVATAVRQAKGDKALANEEVAWNAYQEYLKTMQKVPAKSAPDAQKALLGQIVTRCPGTYAADIAAMIASASKVQLTVAAAGKK